MRFQPASKAFVFPLVIVVAATAQSFGAGALLVSQPNDNIFFRPGREESPAAKQFGDKLDELQERTRKSVRTEADLVRMFGPAVEWKEADFCLPLYSNGFLSIQTGFSVDANGKTSPGEPMRTFLVGDRGAVLVSFYEGNPPTVIDVLLYLRTDKDFVPLQSADDVPRRLKWDQTRLAGFQDALEKCLKKKP